MKKLIIAKDIITLDLDLMGIDEAIELFQKLKEEHSKDWTDLHINLDSYCEGGYELNLRGKRYETDEEYKNRVNYLKEREERQLANDRAEYERLKAVFKH